MVADPFGTSKETADMKYGLSFLIIEVAVSRVLKE